MSKGSVNKVILIGNLGNEPDVRYMPSGTAVANISVATSDSWQDKQTGERQERTEWHKVVFFGRQAEIVKQYLHKGSKVYIEGRLQTDKWQDQQGQERYTTKIHSFQMVMLDSRGEGGGYNAPGGYGAQGGAGSGGAPNYGGGGGTPANNQPDYQAPSPNQGMNQSQPPAVPNNEGVNQSSPATDETPPPDKGFDQDVPF